MSASPFRKIPVAQWRAVTKRLVANHPLNTEELVEICLESWNDIFRSRIGKKAFIIGKQILPKPQIMGFFLHELIPLNIATRYPKLWRLETDARDKDIVYLPDDAMSIEIKTSSSVGKIFGNRSYAQGVMNPKKNKSGYYLAINFEKFSATEQRPNIKMVRFGWLDHEDWIGQTAATGQQARLETEVEQGKLMVLYERST